MFIMNPSNTTNTTGLKGWFTSINAGLTISQVEWSGVWNTAGAITAVRIYMNSGNISGEFNLYGLL